MDQRVFFTSIPKCGKNILYSMFGGLGYRRHVHKDDSYSAAAYFAAFDRVNYVYVSSHESQAAAGSLDAELARMRPRSVFHRHLLPTREFSRAFEAAGIKPVFVVRDPRDALLSAANYALAGKPSHIVERMPPGDLRAATLFLLRGDNDTVPFADHFDAYRAWLHEPRTLTIRFEDIIGVAGGGSADAQRECLERVLVHVGSAHTPDDVETAARHVFNPRAGTFRRGQIGGWRDFADPALDAEFKRLAGHLLGPWGYA
jgi:hypothetical protein